MNKKIITIMILLFGLMPFMPIYAATSQAIPVMVAKSAAGGVTYSLTIKIIAVMALLTVLPALVITMSAFTRIIVVMAILRQAIGIPNVPSNQILIGLSLIMSIFVMMPFLQNLKDQAYTPYISGTMTEEQALIKGSSILKTFMLKQTRKTDLMVFSRLAKEPVGAESDPSIFILMPAYITSELKTAFEIGFLIFIPFLIIDLVVASVLMSMGMMMLSPMVISLPIKLLFFVIVNGWDLIVTSLITSFRM